MARRSAAKATADKINEAVKSVKESTDKTPIENVNPEWSKTLSTGSTLLDLAISSGRKRGGGVPGSILMEVYGPSGAGKCIVGDSYVYAKGEMQPIDRLSMGKDGYTECEIKTISDKGPEKTTHFYEETVAKTHYVKNDLGMTIEGTANHPLLVFDGKVRFVKMSKIKKNSLVCIPTELDYFPEKDFRIKFSDVLRTNTCHTIRPPKRMTPQLGRMLGYLVANGHIAGTEISMYTTNKGIEGDFRNICTSLGVKCGPYNDYANSLHCKGRAFKRFVAYLLGGECTKSRKKYVPLAVLQSTKEVQRGFLQGLIDCDSYLGEGTVLEYYTASATLATQVQLMLQNFGIITKKVSKYLKEYDHTYWGVHSSSMDYHNLFDTILRNSLKYTENKEYVCTQNYTGYPIREWLLGERSKIKNTLGVSKAGRYKKNGKNIVFSLFSSLSQINSKDMNRKVPIKDIKGIIQASVDYDFEIVRKLVHKLTELTKFRLSKVVKVEQRRAVTRVYDFTMATSHRFVSNGFISHNTSILSELCGSAQHNKGEVMFLDPEARLDEEYSRIYGMSLNKEFYHRPDTVTEMFKYLTEWHPQDTNINVLAADSLAALSTELEMESSDKMGMRRAKELSEGLRKTARLIGERNQIIACSNQLRQGQYGTTTPGGMSVGYYASLRIEMKNAGKIEQTKKTSGGASVTRVTGIQSLCKVTKSSIDRPYREAPVYIMFDLGIDDVRGNLQWLKDMSKATKYLCVDKEYARMNDAIAYIEGNNMESELRNNVIDMWEEIEAKFSNTRKKVRR